VLKPWNIAPPFRLGEKQVGTHQIGCVPWLLSRLTRPVALNFPIFAGLFFVVCHSAVATTEFSGSVWAIRALGEHDVLGISFGVAVVDWGTPVRAEDILERGMKSKRGIPSSFERTRPPAVPLVVRAT